MNTDQEETHWTMHPVATVCNERTEADDDFWGPVVSEIRLAPGYGEDSLREIESFSHLEILYIFHRTAGMEPVTGSEHPRENPRWPLTGIFAQRKKNRPNRIGSTIVTLIRKDGRSLFVKNLDAINGTPVIDIKPVMRQFLPREPVVQPGWVDELMKDYWG